jgi:hypothetical protein
VDNGRLVAYHDNYWSTDVLWNMLCFDINRKELLPEQDENWHLKDYHFAEQLNSTTIRLFAHYTTVPCKGTLIAFMHGNRVCPGIVIDNSEFVTVQGVTVHHAMGMALIAQVSNNITLDRFNVVPSQGRVFSSWVDATHFADCDGTIELKDCCFKGQFDDASNIHGAFWNVDKIHSSKKIAVKIMHPQQAGVVVFRKGDVVKFYHRKSLGYLSENTIANVKIHSNSEYELDLTRDLQLNSGQLVVSRYTEHCFVHIHNCEFGANRGRGLLLSQSGTIHVEENIFHVSGSAIVMAGDTTYWWESSAVNNVLIKNNRFIDCNFGVCGKYLFAVCPDIEKENRSDFFHKNISIVDNDIICHHSSILSARCISGLIYKNNRCVRSASYAFNSSLKPLDLQEMVESVEIEVS